MSDEVEVRWPLHPAPEVGRQEIAAAFASALQVMAGGTIGETVRTRQGDNRGEHVGYWAAEQWWHTPVGSAALIWHTDPIMASMGVSGEYMDFEAEGLPGGASFSGRALSSARRPGWARLACTHASVASVFREAFGPFGSPSGAVRVDIAEGRVRIDLSWMLLSEEELRRELAELGELMEQGTDEARGALVRIYRRLRDKPDWQPHYPQVLAWAQARWPV